MSSDGIKIGDVRFVYDTPSEDSGRLLRYSGAEKNPEWVAVAKVHTAHLVGAKERTVLVDIFKSAGLKDSDMHSTAVSDAAKMFRALDNAVRAVEKNVSGGFGEWVDLDGSDTTGSDVVKSLDSGPSDAHIVEVVMRSIDEGGALGQAIAKKFGAVAIPVAEHPPVRTDVGATANARAEV